MTIAGSGPDEARLRALAARARPRDGVAFTGRLDRDADGRAVPRRPTSSLNPSRVDNMPNSLLEAMASGVPVVSTNVGGVPFIVRDEATALLVEPGDAAAMAAATLRLLNDARAVRSGCATPAWRRCRRYTWPRVAPVLLSIYHRAVASDARRTRHGVMYTRLVSSLLFPLHERFKRHDSVAVRRRMEAAQWWSAEQLAALAASSGCAPCLSTRRPTCRTTASCSSREGFDPAAVRGLRRSRNACRS